MKKKQEDNFLFSPPNNAKTVKQIRQGYVDEYRASLESKEKENSLNKKALEKKFQEEKVKEEDFDYSKIFKYQGYEWTFGPLDWQKKDKIKQKIEALESKMKKIGNAKKALSLDMTLFRNDLLSLIKQIFPERLLQIPNPDIDSMYYDKKLKGAHAAHKEKAYEFFLEKFIQQFYGYSLGNFTGHIGWTASEKGKLITKTLKMIKELGWRL